MPVDRVGTHGIVNTRPISFQRSVSRRLVGRSLTLRIELGELMVRSRVPRPAQVQTPCGRHRLSSWFLSRVRIFQENIFEILQFFSEKYQGFDLYPVPLCAACAVRKDNRVLQHPRPWR